MSDGEYTSSDRARMPVTSLNLQPGEAVKDIMQGLSMWRIWIALSWQEFNSTYQRSIIGVMWVMLAFAGFVFVKLIIFSSLIDTDDSRYYNAYLVVGFFTWVYLNQSINSAADVFISAQSWIRSEPLPFSLYIFKNIMREIYNLGFTFIVIVAALLYIGFPVTLGALYAIPALLFLLLNAFSIKLLLGLVSARVRDIPHLVKAVMMPMMFLTPIFWLPSQMSGLMKYLWWNPLFHYMEIFRAPILDGHIPVTSWIYSLILYVIITITSFLMFARFRQRIVFWF